MSSRLRSQQQQQQSKSHKQQSQSLSLSSHHSQSLSNSQSNSTISHSQNGVLPSPATSDSTLSNDSYLYTPESHSTSLPSNDKSSVHHLQLSAHSNFFQSAQLSEDGPFQFGNDSSFNQENQVDRYRPRTSQGSYSQSHQDSTPTLGNPVEFYGQSDLNSSISPSNLGKRQLGHIRTPSAGRRHSIQAIMPLAGINGSPSISGTSWSEAAAALNAGIGIMESPSNGLYAREGLGGGEGGFDAEVDGSHNITDYLVSPPRNMFNLAPNSRPDWKQGNELLLSSSPDEAKRQRVGADFNTPDGDRSRGRDSTPLAPQGNDNVTPPSNAWTSMRAIPPNTGSSTASSSNRNSNLSGLTQDTSWTPGSPSSRSNDRICQSRYGNQAGSELGLDLNLGNMGIDPRSHQLLNGFAPDSAFASSQEPHSLLDRSLSMSSVSEASVEETHQVPSTSSAPQSIPQEASPPPAKEEPQKEESQSTKAPVSIRRKKDAEEDKWPEEVEVAFWEGE